MLLDFLGLGRFYIEPFSYLVNNLFLDVGTAILVEGISRITFL